jgi:hypothetical protein
VSRYAQYGWIFITLAATLGDRPTQTNPTPGNFSKKKKPLEITHQLFFLPHKNLLVPLLSLVLL